jgi:hypothetical protein
LSTSNNDFLRDSVPHAVSALDEYPGKKAFHHPIRPL